MMQRSWMPVLLVWTVLTVGAAGAYSRVVSGTAAAGQESTQLVTVTPGYTIQTAASQLTAPVGIAVAPRGEVYIAESGADTGTPPRVIKLTPGRETDRITVAADFPARLTGLTWHDGKLYVAYAGGVDLLDPATGIHHPILTKLPAGGDHANGAVVVGDDGKIYFGIGTATNSGVIGLDNMERGWVKPNSDIRDIPCKTIRLRGLNFTVSNPLTPDPLDLITTGAFSAVGKTTARKQAVPGAVPCTGSVLRANADGTGLELVAWGLRNPAGLAYGPDGELYATMQGFEERGSRPVVGDSDYLYRVVEGQWYGWPDFAGGRSITREEFQKPNFPATPLLDDVPGQPPSPIATFAHGAGAAGLLFPPQSFGLRGDALVALAGAGAGPQVVRLNPRTGKAEAFAYNTSTGDGSRLQRPVALAAGPRGEIYLLDSGQTRPAAGLPQAVPGTGILWKIEAHPVPARLPTASLR